MLYDIVIAGAGPAGLTAALYARRAGHSVLVLEGGVPGGQAVTTPHVENWPGTLSISGPDFAMGLYQQCTELGRRSSLPPSPALRTGGTERRSGRESRSLRAAPSFWPTASAGGN